MRCRDSCTEMERAGFLKCLTLAHGCRYADGEQVNCSPRPHARTAHFVGRKHHVSVNAASKALDSTPTDLGRVAYADGLACLANARHAVERAQAWPRRRHRAGLFDRRGARPRCPG